MTERTEPKYRILKQWRNKGFWGADVGRCPWLPQGDGSRKRTGLGAWRPWGQLQTCPKLWYGPKFTSLSEAQFPALETSRVKRTLLLDLRDVVHSSEIRWPLRNIQPETDLAGSAPCTPDVLLHFPPLSYRLRCQDGQDASNRKPREAFQLPSLSALGRLGPLRTCASGAAPDLRLPGSGDLGSWKLPNCPVPTFTPSEALLYWLVHLFTTECYGWAGLKAQLPSDSELAAPRWVAA